MKGKVSITSPLHKIRKEVKSRQPVQKYDESKLIGEYLCVSDGRHWSITNIDKISAKKPLVIGKCLDCQATPGALRMYVEEFEKQVKYGYFVKSTSHTPGQES